MGRQSCPGPLIWYDVSPEPARQWSLAALLECSTCGYVIVTGNWHDPRHAYSPLLREGMAS